MTAWLARNGFPGVPEHTVDRLTRLAGVSGLVRGGKTRTTIPATDGKRAGSLPDRDFTAPLTNHSIARSPISRLSPPGQGSSITSIRFTETVALEGLTAPRSGPSATPMTTPPSRP